MLRGIAFQPDEGVAPAAAALLGELAAARQAELRVEVQGLAEGLLTEPPRQRLARLDSAFRAARVRPAGEAAAASPRAAESDAQGER